MQLTLNGPPGRANRKARAYHAEIHRLRAADYTFEAIRRALHNAGIEVSLATVKREAAKPLPTLRQQPDEATASRLSGGARNRPQAIASQPTGRPSSMPSKGPLAFVNDGRTGKQIVEDFMKGRITNPLLQERN